MGYIPAIFWLMTHRGLRIGNAIIHCDSIPANPWDLNSVVRMRGALDRVLVGQRGEYAKPKRDVHAEM